MALAGVPEKHIMQVTGHKTRHMLDRYNIAMEQDTQNTFAQTQADVARRRATQHGQGTDTGQDTGELLKL